MKALEEWQQEYIAFVNRLSTEELRQLEFNRSEKGMWCWKYVNKEISRRIISNTMLEERK